MPDGVYEADVGWLDDDGRNRGKLLPVKVEVEIEGDELTIDLTGLERRGADRLQLAPSRATVSAMTYIVRTIFLDEATYPVFVPAERGDAARR